MNDLPTWADWAQIISVAIAILAIIISAVVSVVVYRRTKQRRALSCEFDPIVSPIEIKAGAALGGDLEIGFKNQTVDNLFLVRAKLKCTGNLPIRKQHVIAPVTFTFNPASWLLRWPQVVRSKPRELKIRWGLRQPDRASEPVEAILEFDLLNPGDEFAVEFLCTGDSDLPTLSARIEGVARIDQFTPETLKPPPLVAFTAILGIVVTLSALILVILNPDQQEWVGLLALALGGLVLASPLVVWLLIRTVLPSLRGN